MKLLKLILIAIFLILCGIGIGTDLDNIYPNIAGHTANGIGLTSVNIWCFCHGHLLF